MNTLRLGNSLDKCIDMGTMVDETQRKSVAEFVEAAKDEGASVYQIQVPEGGCFYPPTLITGIGTTSKCFVEEIFGPVLVAMKFR